MDLARPTSGSELYPNANLDLARVSMDILLLWRYLESDPNDKNVAYADLHRYALHLTVECACRCGDSAYASRM